DLFANGDKPVSAPLTKNLRQCNVRENFSRRRNAEKDFSADALTPRAARCILRFAVPSRKVEVKAWGGLVLHDIHTRALKRATEILGGEEKLRTFLGATEIDYSAW